MRGRSRQARSQRWWPGLSALSTAGVVLPLWGQVVAPPVPQASRQAPLVLRGVTVIDVRDGQRQPDQAVMITGSRIEIVGTVAAVAVPRGAQVVEAQGKYLIPGLWDLHVHPQRYADIAYPLFIANGVTGVRDAGSVVPLVTLSRWKQEIAAGTRVGPRLLVSGPAIDGPRCTSFAFHVCISTPADARLLVDVLYTAGADMIKTYSLSAELYFAIAAEARRLGIPFGGHAPNVAGQVASDSGATFLDHDTWFNPFVCGLYRDGDVPEVVSADACAAAAQQLRRNHTWITLGTSILPVPIPRKHLDSLYLVKSARTTSLPPFHPTSTADWAAIDTDASTGAQRLAAAFKQLHAAGMPAVIGTDAFEDNLIGGVPGFSVAEVLVSLVVRGGFTPLEALQTATLNPALAFRATDSLGTVEAGKLADLVLLDADPLADIWNTTRIRAVVANGRYYDRAALDGLLRTAAADAHQLRSARARTNAAAVKATNATTSP